MIDQNIVKIIQKSYHAMHHNNDYINGNLGFGLIHYSFIRNLKPEKVLVIGSQRGYVPAICALACKDNSYGKVYFVDAGYDTRIKGEDGKLSWGGKGIWKKATKDYWKPLGAENFIDLFVMTTEVFIKEWKDGQFEYIYIDGDHNYEGVKKDYELTWDFLKPKGLMVFHDVLVEKETCWGKCGVKKFWDEIKNKHTQIMIYKNVGLGIIMKE